MVLHVLPALPRLYAGNLVLPYAVFRCDCALRSPVGANRQNLINRQLRPVALACWLLRELVAASSTSLCMAIALVVGIVPKEQVRWVATWWVVATVKYICVGWNFAKRQGPCGTMGQNRSTINGETSIGQFSAGLKPMPGPQPALCSGRLRYTRPEALTDGGAHAVNYAIGEAYVL